MKKAIQFGAGNIGRGFIGAVLEQAGYHVVFADVNQEVIDRINRDGKYTVHIMDVECIDQTISNVSGVNSATDAIVKEIADPETRILTTAVGVRILPFIAPAIAKGIALRREKGCKAEMNIIACENAVKATSQLKEHVWAKLSDEDKEYAERMVGFADCAVDRIVPPVRSENPIDVVVEAYFEWDVEKSQLKGEMEEIPGMTLVDGLVKFVERKLFTLNTGHAITAYTGKMKGHATIDESIADPKIFAIVKAAMQQSGLGLIAKYGFDKEAHFAYIEKIIRRFKNPYLKDDVTRVGREPLRKLSASDRLIKPTLTAREFGIETPDLLLGIGAALHFQYADDAQAVEMQQAIAEKGLKAAVASFASLETDAPILDEIIKAYDQVEKAIN